MRVPKGLFQRVEASLCLFQRTGTIVMFVSKGRGHRYVCPKEQGQSCMFRRARTSVIHVPKDRDRHYVCISQVTRTVVMYLCSR